MKEPKVEPVPRAQISGPTKPQAFALGYRTQNDTLGDKISDETALHTGDETPVRQEFKHTTDINNILQEYRSGMIAPKPGTFGDEVDMNFDLTDAYTALATANRATLNVPPELKSQFPTWESVLNGVENGSYQHALNELERQKQDAAERRQQQTAPVTGTDQAQKTAPETQTPTQKGVS